MAGRVFRESKQFPGHLCTFHAPFDRVFPPLPRHPSVGQLLRRFCSSLLIPWKKHFAFRDLRVSTCTREYDQSRHAYARNWRVIHPHSRFRLGWQAFMIIVIVLSLIVKSFTVSFIHVHYFSDASCRCTCLGRALSVAAFVIDMLFALNILIKFRTGYNQYQNSTIVMGRRLVAKHYISTWFLPDIVTCTASAHFLTYVIEKTDPENKLLLLVLHAISLASLYRIVELCVHISTWITHLGGKRSTSRIVQFIVVFFILCHFMACLHFYVPLVIHKTDALKAYENNQSWLAEYNTSLCGNYPKNYLQCFDRSVSLFTGFGFQFPETVDDQCLFLFNSWGGKALLVFAFAVALEISHSGAQMTLSRERTIRELTDFMKSKKMPAKLQQRMLQYFNYRLQGRFFDEKTIFQSLPKALQNDVKYFCCRNILENLPMFQNVPRKVLNEAAQAMEEVVFLRNDVVYSVGAEADGAYFVASGTLMMVAPTGEELRHYAEGTCFGEAEVVRDTKRASGVVALETCELLFLTATAFERLLLGTPQLRASLTAAALATEAAVHDLIRRRVRARDSAFSTAPSAAPTTTATTKTTANAGGDLDDLELSFSTESSRSSTSTAE